MAEESKKSRRVVYKAELVWYGILGALWLFGLILSILGVCAYNVGKISSNTLYGAEKAWASFFGMPEGSILDFRILGSVIMIVCMLVFFVVIFLFSSKASEEKAAERRRQERMRILMDSPLNVPSVSSNEKDAAAKDR